MLKGSPAAAGTGEAPALGNVEAGISQGAGGGGGDCWPPQAGGVRRTLASLRYPRRVAAVAPGALARL
eukprot:14654472-Alexandrium_andersonii.AAC.1